jgi:hypothetical protein
VHEGENLPRVIDDEDVPFMSLAAHDLPRLGIVGSATGDPSGVLLC